MSFGTSIGVGMCASSQFSHRLTWEGISHSRCRDVKNAHGNPGDGRVEWGLDATESSSSPAAELAI